MSLVLAHVLLSLPLDSASVKSRARALVASMSPHYFWLLCFMFLRPSGHSGWKIGSYPCMG